MGLRVTGLEHLPPSGPFLLSPNHQSYLDGFLLVGALPYADVQAAVLRRRERVLRDAGHAEARRAHEHRAGRSRRQSREGDAGRRLRPAARPASWRCSPRASGRRTAPRGGSRRAPPSRRCRRGCRSCRSRSTASSRSGRAGQGCSGGALLPWARTRSHCGSARRFRPDATPRGRERPLRTSHRAAEAAVMAMWNDSEDAAAPVTVSRAGRAPPGQQPGWRPRPQPGLVPAPSSRPAGRVATARAPTLPRAGPGGRSARSWWSAGRSAAAGSAARRSRPAGSRTSSRTRPPPSRRPCRTCRP